MTKSELIKQLDDYDDDAIIEIKMADMEDTWYGIVEVINFVPFTSDHILLKSTDGPTMA